MDGTGAGKAAVSIRVDEGGITAFVSPTEKILVKPNFLTAASAYSIVRFPERRLILRTAKRMYRCTITKNVSVATAVRKCVRSMLSLWEEIYLKRLKEKFRAFVKDRNGLDDLGLTFAVLAVLVLGLAAVTCSWMILLAGIILLTGAFFRILSRNTEARRQENLRFLGMWEHHRFHKQSRQLRRQEKKFYRYLKCPHCKKVIRVPKGKGEQRVLCPHCGKWAVIVNKK